MNIQHAVRRKIQAARQGLKLVVARQVQKYPAIYKIYRQAKHAYRPVELLPPDSIIQELLSDSQNQKAIASLKAHRRRIEAILPRLPQSAFEDVINIPDFTLMTDPVHKDIPSCRRFFFRARTVRAFFVRMVFLRPYDQPQAYLFKMMDRVEDLGPIYALPAYRYLFAAFHSYASVGEAQRHIDFLESALHWFHKRQGSSPIPPQERLALFSYAYSGSFPSSNEKNLKAILQIERSLVKQMKGGVDDYQLRPRRNAKIKIGLLRYNGRGEINFFRPILDGLPLEKYEIHLVVLDADGTDDLMQRYKHIQLHVLDKQQMAISAKKVRDIGLDILINTSSLSGDFLNPVVMILINRLAPIQISYCADISTSGIDVMDYFLIGERLGAADLQDELVETVLTCPGVGFYIPPPAPVVGSYEAKRAELGLAGNEILFASNAHLLKLTPDLIAVWLKIVSQVPNAKLLLMPFSSDFVAGRFGRTFMTMLWRLCRQAGVPKSRIVLSRAQGRVGTMTDLQAADIYLDSFPYSGATSGAEALSLGLPIVTRTGPNMRARYLAAMLDELGMGDEVTQDTAGYIQQALALAKSSELRRNFSARIQKSLTKASFFNAEEIAGQLDEVFDSLMQNHGDTLLG